MVILGFLVLLFTMFSFLERENFNSGSITCLIFLSPYHEPRKMLERPNQNMVKVTTVKFIQERGRPSDLPGRSEKIGNVVRSDLVRRPCRWLITDKLASRRIICFGIRFLSLSLKLSKLGVRV